MDQPASNHVTIPPPRPQRAPEPTSPSSEARAHFSCLPGHLEVAGLPKSLSRSWQANRLCSPVLPNCRHLFHKRKDWLSILAAHESPGELLTCSVPATARGSSWTQALPLLIFPSDSRVPLGLRTRALAPGCQSHQCWEPSGNW